jgi:hypothetical protein
MPRVLVTSLQPRFALEVCEQVAYVDVDDIS